MARDVLFVGDTLIPIFLTVKDRETKAARNLAGFTSGKIRFKKPDGTIVDKTATLVDGPNGIIKYVTQNGDIDQDGQWSMQPYQITTSTDGPWSGDEDTFTVRPVLAASS